MEPKTGVSLTVLCSCRLEVRLHQYGGTGPKGVALSLPAVRKEREVQSALACEPGVRVSARR